jgi:hypothetical protein
MHIGTLHLGKVGPRRLPALRHCIAYDVAGCGLVVHGEDELVDRIS